MRQSKSNSQENHTTDHNAKSRHANSFHPPISHTMYSGNVENYIGLTQVPTGLVGPLQINGQYANGEFKIPLATTEGALVASYSRGASAITKSGGAVVAITEERLQRCPAFYFENMQEAQQFITFVHQNKHHFPHIMSTQTAHGKLLQVQDLLLGHAVILTFWYNTADAAGQNMITFCTDAICKYLVAQSPVEVQQWYIESNMSGDKKASAYNLSQQRGKKLVAEVIIPKDIVTSTLKTIPNAMLQYHQCAMQAAAMSGALGMQGHFANGLAALFLATGNDVACVAESACGLTQVSLTHEGDLRASVIIPSFTAGTVGGGTKLPTQQAALRLMGCEGKDKARKYAEIAAGLVLAGELSIMAAIAAGHFSAAHKTFGR